MRVWVSLCKYILICICVPRFPNCYVVMRGQTLVRGTQIYSYQCHIFADNNCHYCDYLSLYKSYYWFKITWKYFPKWYNKGYHWLFKGSCYLTFHFYQEGDWLWDISPTLTTTLGWTGSFQFWLGYSVKFFVYLFVCRLHYFLQKYNNLFENIVLDLWRKLSWGSKCTKLFSRLVLCQEELFFEVYFSNFCVLFPCLFFCLFMFLNFLKTIQLLHISLFYRCTWYYPEDYFGRMIFCSWELFFLILWNFVHMLFVLLWALF